MTTNGSIRVLRVIARLNVGGPALQASVLSEGLDPDRFQQLLVAGSVGDGEADYVSLRAPQLRVRHIPGLGRDPAPFADIRALRQLRRVIADYRPHIVHTHTAKAGTLGRMAAWSAKVPATVHTFHGHLLHGYFSPARTRAVVRAERALARPTTRLVAVGAKVRDELLAAGIGRPRQFSIVPPGVELPTPPRRDAARRALGLAGEAPVVAFVARLTRVKRPDRFVAVARAVLATHPDAVFVVVGEGELLDGLRRQAAPLGSSIRFLGWRGDVETVYSACDVVILTSDNEGTPVSLIEAASCGRPAVTTRVGSAAEVVLHGSTGFVTAPDVGALARAVGLLLGDGDLRRRMGAAATEHARRSYGAARLAADTAALYEAVLAELAEKRI
jgi:glycosyltransferase involved in cell wall biosynthesis